MTEHVTDSLSDVGQMNEPRADHSSSLLDDGRVLLAGGNDGLYSLDTIEIFDPATESFALSSLTLLEPREGHTATTMPNGRILIEGGWNDGGLLESAEIIDPFSMTIETASGLEGLLFHAEQCDGHGFGGMQLVGRTAESRRGRLPDLHLDLHGER